MAGPDAVIPDAAVTEWQPELPFPPVPLPTGTPPLPARMINEYVYCPRLAYLEWVQGEWADSADTVDGRHVHRRVDRPGGALPAPGTPDGDDTDTEAPRVHARSVTVASERLGLIARIDVAEVEDGAAVPVDYKRGKRPHVAAGAHDPERVQLCVQGMLLEEAGHRCDHGVLYFAESRERVRVPFDEELRALTRSAIDGLSRMARDGRIPPPLPDSPKCPRCSLVGICLPDEVGFLAGALPSPRAVAVPRDEALPVYIVAQYAKAGKKAETIEIAVEEQPPTTVRLVDVSQIAAFGNVSVTTPLLHELMRREVPVTWHTHGGWFLGHTVGTGHGNVELRTAQYRASFDPAFCLRLARGIVEAKIRNARTLLRRNGTEGAELAVALADLDRLAKDTRRVEGMDRLLGLEGAAAACYFGLVGTLLKPPDPAAGRFDFRGRNRRPPADPVNACLSFAYALLVRTLTVTLSAVGFDPYRGFYHQPRWGRPALALDLMEPFRPLLADSVVITALNTGEVKAGHFVQAGGGTALTPDGRRALIGAFERRLSQEITHPVFGYRISYRRTLELQARLLGRLLLGEIADLPHVVPR
ncbi:CRISPR-associated endonuclease Cas1 [Azospirillum sp. RWY-5-1]|uniref:CRISPR-associated endonuclease Cas1 n=1 Tax=Azospirillum oleiclasticum TaxID=2735135 RepID=A0ABX2T8S5_9PROT|nr:CRISPR-associated endonuclease Cas1 [Azospirillum oleiclasticum]NYZ13539.1 CRISPR-associated endonuclease Cas1 [Azospirillum oleiclasticum]NYZ20700.1 CRISPR-associated endonuclease Cas1 [Azospirillum oleiclasticum]